MSELITNETIIAFIRQKLADAESTLKSRVEMKRIWRSGTNASWSAACALHPATAGKGLSKSERLKEAGIHERIAVKLKQEVELFRATLEVLSTLPSTPHPEGSGRHANDKEGV